MCIIINRWLYIRPRSTHTQKHIHRQLLRKKGWGLVGRVTVWLVLDLGTLRYQLLLQYQETF